MLLRQPSIDELGRFIEAQRKLDFTYAAAGATATTPPAGFTVDRTRVQLGSGQAVFERAQAALRRWKQFDLGWVRAWPDDTPLEPGRVVAVVAHAAGFWWRNTCRIVYAVDEPGPVRRFGFAYGTLPGHVESGEERFLLEWNQADDSVWYDILAFSRPNRWPAKVGYPLVRRMQRRFARHSAASMQRAACG